MIPTVTRPLEEALLRVPGIQRVLSTTSRGSAEIERRVRLGHRHAGRPAAGPGGDRSASRPDLPADTRVDVEWMNTAIFPILGYALTSDTRSQAELLAARRVHAQAGADPHLRASPRSRSRAAAQREFQVRLDPQRSPPAASPPPTSSTRSGRTTCSSAGLDRANHELYLSLVDGRVPTGSTRSAGIAVPLAGGGSPRPSPSSGRSRPPTRSPTSAPPPTASRRCWSTSSASRRRTRSRSRAASASCSATARPAAARRRAGRPSTTRREFVRHSVDGVRDAILIGVVLAALVLLVFLRNFRLTLVAVADDPGHRRPRAARPRRHRARPST